MSKEMLVVVDYQNDFVNGSLGFTGAEKLDEGIAQEMMDAAKRGDVIVVTRDTHEKNYLETREGKNLPVVHTVRGTEGWELYGKVGETAKNIYGIIYVDKNVFAMSPEDAMGLPNGIEKVRIVGLVSNICVLSQAVILQARYPEATIEVVEHLTDSFDKDLHEATMKVLGGIQVKVV